MLTIRNNCGGDSPLLSAAQTGPACHTGQRSCFHNALKGEAPVIAAILLANYDTIVDRDRSPQEGSYTNHLLAKGIERTCKKVGEEASETIIAAIRNSFEETRYEAADLMYHPMVLLYQRGLTPQDIWGELEKRR